MLPAEASAIDYLVLFCISVYPLKHLLPLSSLSLSWWLRFLQTHLPLSPQTLTRFNSRSFVRFVFQSWCTMTCSQSGKPSGRPSTSLLVTLSSSLPWRWWRSTGTSSWRTTWTSLTLLSSSMVKHAALQLTFTYTPLILHIKGQFSRHGEYHLAWQNSVIVCEKVTASGLSLLGCRVCKFITKGLLCRVVAGNLKDVSIFKRHAIKLHYGNCRNQHCYVRAWLILGTERILCVALCCTAFVRSFLNLSVAMERSFCFSLTWRPCFGRELFCSNQSASSDVFVTSVSFSVGTEADLVVAGSGLVSIFHVDQRNMQI